MIRFIVNPTAGANKTRKRWPILESHARKVLSEFDVVFTEYRGHAIELAKKAALEGIDTIVAVGGDGTINEVVNGIHQSGRDVRLGIIDCGTGADFVRTVDVGKTYIESIDNLKNGKTRQFDIIEAQFPNMRGKEKSRVFVNASDIGLGGDTVINVDGSPKVLGGRLAFLYGVLRSIVRLKIYPVRLKLDGNEIGEFEIISTIVANGKYFAGGMFVAPMADPQDGKFEVILIKKTTRRRFIRNLPLVYKGTHIYIDEVEHFTESTLEVTSEEEVMVEMDGELVGYLPVKFKVLPKALKIITRGENHG